MAPTQTVRVPHLDAQVGYKISNGKIDPSKPTFILINSLTTTVDLYNAELTNPKLTAAANLVAIEPLGHGATSTSVEHFTYWDSALVTLQAAQALGVSKAFSLGTSQGGWIAVRTALLAPERIQGVIILGSSMDSESADSRSKGCWDPFPIVGPFLQKWSSSTPTPDFVVGDDWIQPVMGLGFGAAATDVTVGTWTQILKSVYAGDEGRKKLRMSVINLAERDGLLLRLGDIKCPVHWLQGVNEPVYGSVVQKEQIKLFTASKEAKLDLIDGGAHFLNATNPKEVEEAILGMVAKA
ncbi:putative alpha/beta hydrolase [Hypoxylon trugodes]|uniref:putative alpha/beta hydrolase n=1 Tax=Hypoxylon trugodes TaxID=326681 RepID=UPI00219CBCCD|nr:putative alpha/beta hydrolase [Hypoxylon trugodes]KAI1385538.1 putative alpha/beta hydrolase [Hypoxylon trugodes]